MKYLSEYKRFEGTGERNAQGKTLDEFLEAYDPRKYDCPSNTVDMLVFQRIAGVSEGNAAAILPGQEHLRLLMIRRRNHPNIGMWALPGGFVELRENLEDAAKRELMEETGVENAPMIQLKTYGDYDRDPRWRVITTAYLAVLDADVPVKAGDDAADAVWFDVGFETLQEDGETYHLLTLRSCERGMCLQAKTQEIVRDYGILKDRREKLVFSDGIAGDHGEIITDAMLAIRGRFLD